MNIEQLKESNKIIFECIAGSQCYGTALPTSDVDIRGIFLNTNRDVFSLFPAPVQVGDEKHDTVYYELRRFIELALNNNPQILEMLAIPEDCIKYISPIWQKIIDNRHLFICKKARHTFSGYAIAQVKKAKGQHKWVHNAKSEKRPVLSDFCWIVPNSSTSWKPIPVTDYTDDILFSNCKISGFEHLPYSYRLYGPFNTKDVGVFHGGVPYPKSITKDEEQKFIGMLIVNHDAYTQELRDWQNYWEWKKNRNDARWIAQEKGEIDFDTKNMAHCIRLLLSGINILKNHLPIVRLTGSDLTLVKDIRAGMYNYDDIMSMVQIYEADLLKLYETSSLRNEPDRNAINNLYLEIIGL
jgi:predicted nucleotidyltransferase